MGKIVAVDISDQPTVRPSEAIMVIEMGEFPQQRAMREIWHGTKEDARALRDALDALLPAAALASGPDYRAAKALAPSKPKLKPKKKS